MRGRLAPSPGTPHPGPLPQGERRCSAGESAESRIRLGLPIRIVLRLFQVGQLPGQLPGRLRLTASRRDLARLGIAVCVAIEIERDGCFTAGGHGDATGHRHRLAVAHDFRVDRVEVFRSRRQGRRHEDAPARGGGGRLTVHRQSCLGGQVDDDGGWGRAIPDLPIGHRPGFGLLFGAVDTTRLDNDVAVAVGRVATAMATAMAAVAAGPTAVAPAVAAAAVTAAHASAVAAVAAVAARGNRTMAAAAIAAVAASSTKRGRFRITRHCHHQNNGVHLLTLLLEERNSCALGATLPGFESKRVIWKPATALIFANSVPRWAIFNEE